jgi:hypothetical protein
MALQSYTFGRSSAECGRAPIDAQPERHSRIVANNERMKDILFSGLAGIEVVVTHHVLRLILAEIPLIVNHL